MTGQIAYRNSDMAQEAKLQREAGKHSLRRGVLLGLDGLLHEQLSKLHRCGDFNPN